MRDVIILPEGLLIKKGGHWPPFHIYLPESFSNGYADILINCHSRREIKFAVADGAADFVVFVQGCHRKTEVRCFTFPLQAVLADAIKLSLDAETLSCILLAITIACSLDVFPLGLNRLSPTPFMISMAYK
jgi:hypothetical protein